MKIDIRGDSLTKLMAYCKAKEVPPFKLVNTLIDNLDSGELIENILSDLEKTLNEESGCTRG